MGDLDDVGQSPTFAELQEALDAFVSGADKKTATPVLKKPLKSQPTASPKITALAVTPKNVLDLLETLSKCLKPVTDHVIGKFDDGTLIVSSHPALELLDQHIGKLREVGKASAALTTSQRQEDQVLLDTVLIVQKAEGHNSRASAEGAVAAALGKGGFKRRGKVLNRGTLKKLRDHPKKKI